jgi:hypothetical protein
VRSLAARWTLKQVQGDGIFALCAFPRLRRKEPRYATLGQSHKPRHPELVSGSIGKFVRDNMQTRTSRNKFWKAES